MIDNFFTQKFKINAKNPTKAQSTQSKKTALCTLRLCGTNSIPNVILRKVFPGILATANMHHQPAIPVYPRYSG